MNHAVRHAVHRHAHRRVVTRDHRRHERAESVDDGSLLDHENVLVVREHRGERHFVVRLEVAAVHDRDVRALPRRATSRRRATAAPSCRRRRWRRRAPCRRHFPRGVAESARSADIGARLVGRRVARIANRERAARDARSADRSSASISVASFGAVTVIPGTASRYAMSYRPMCVSPSSPTSPARSMQKTPAATESPRRG